MRTEAFSSIGRCLIATPRDQVRNTVDAIRREKFCSVRDALDFISRVKEDPESFLTYEVDKNDRLKMVFWASGTQTQLCLRFADVVIQDNTAQSNRWVLNPNAFVCFHRAMRFLLPLHPLT